MLKQKFRLIKLYPTYTDLSIFNFGTAFGRYKFRRMRHGIFGLEKFQVRLCEQFDDINGLILFDE